VERTDAAEKWTSKYPGEHLDVYIRWEYLKNAKKFI
jgi:hypothetical protein